MTFLFGDVSTEFDKRTTAFEFPGVDGAYIQDNGTSERRYPLLCMFGGGDCDLQAQAFLDLLAERGPGRLDHPLYGRLDVVPFGQITRRDDLVTAANQTIIEVVFWSTLGAVFPSSRLSPKLEVTESLRLATPRVAGEFGRTMALATEAQRSGAKLGVLEAIRAVQGALRRVSAATESVNREFRELQREINFGIDVLIGQPLLLAEQILNLTTAPARALVGIAERLRAYRALLDRMIASSSASPADGAALGSVRARLSNDFHTADLVGTGALLGGVSSVLNNTFAAKPDALVAAETVVELAAGLTAWREGRYGDLEQIDTGEGYQAWQETAALTVGYLVEISFTLVPERAIVLTRPRGLIELCAELYGSVSDERLNFLVNTNALTGSDIIEIPRGRRVVYYD